MLEQKFIENIEDLRHHTYSRITNLQKDLCPMVRDVYLNYQFEYWYKGYKHRLWEDDVHYYAVNDIPYCYDNDLKNVTYRDTLDHLVAQDKVWPFLLFINGEAIRWSKITVIHDYDYSYLRIDDITPDYSLYAKMVVFPIHSKLIRYGEDNDVITTSNRKGFYFGKDGKRLESLDTADVSIRLEILDENIYYKEVDITSLDSDILRFEDLPDGYIPTLDNILTFNGDGTFNKVGPSEKIGDLYKGNFGLFNVLNSNSDIKWAILMYNVSNTSKEESFIYSKKDLNRNAVFRLLTENPKEIFTELWEDIITPLIRVFDFDHKFGESYEKNISEATKYITRYDFSLWKEVFKQNAKIKSFCYTGEELKSKSSDGKYVRLSRKHNSELIEDVVIIFVNHKLYYGMDKVVYDTNTILIPIEGIEDEDHVEILMFTEANNTILTLKVVDNETPFYIHPDYNLEDCYIMSENCANPAYTVHDPGNGRKQYIVDCDYTVDDKSNYTITFSDDYYYGKYLSLVPKKQFRYCRFKNLTGQYKIMLPDRFKYCHDIERYLVFVNGKKIDRSEFTITIMNENRPFDRLILYMTTILDPEDYVDVFYIPEILEEKYKQKTISRNGLLLLEDTDTKTNYPKTYPLSKDTALIFINGLKVNPLDIRDISLNSILLNMGGYSGVDSIDNVCIMEYVIGDKEISGYLEGLYEQIPEGEEYNPDNIDFSKPASDSWKDLIKTILEKYPEDGLQKLFGEIADIENPAEDYKENFSPDLRSILYDIIIDYYLTKREATTGEPFVYDFEIDHFDYDSEGKAKEINFYPDKDKMLDYELTAANATEKDVMSGKKFYPVEE